MAWSRENGVIKFNIEKLSADTLKKSKKLGVILITLMLFCGTSFIGKKYANDRRDKCLLLQQEHKVLGVSVETMKTDIQSKQAELTKTGVTSKEMSKDDFVIYLGRVADATQSEIVKLTGGEVQSTNSVSVLNFKVEVAGTLPSITKLVESIEVLGVSYTIQELSVRKDGKYLWQNEEIEDEKDISWLNVDDGKMPEQTIPMPEAVPEIVLNEHGEIVNIKDDRLIGVETLMEGNRVNLYMDINFLIANK